MEDYSEAPKPQDQAGPSPPHRSVSILQSLKAPKASDLTRKRKVDCNPPPKGKRKARGQGSSDPKTVSPGERVREFPDGEWLTVIGKGAGKLFCTACREELSLRRNIVRNHLQSNKHKSCSKEKLKFM